MLLPLQVLQQALLLQRVLRLLLQVPQVLQQPVQVLLPLLCLFPHRRQGSPMPCQPQGEQLQVSSTVSFSYFPFLHKFLL